MKPLKILLILGLTVPLATVSAGDPASFSIDFSVPQPHQIFQTTGNLEFAGVRAELADGTLETVGHGSRLDVFKGVPYLFSANNWKAANLQNAKQFLFTVRATGPYEAVEITGVEFSIQRPVGSSDAFWALQAGDRFVASDGLPIGDSLLIERPVSGAEAAREVTLAIQVWDEGFDKEEVRIARIRGTARITREPVEADSTLNGSEHHAYSANTGWINFRPAAENGTVAGEYFLAGHAWSGNLGWIRLGAGTPVNGWRYGNDSAADFGVNVDDFGDLSGYAYGANIGWINFGWADSDDPSRPRIDLRTGGFHGYAYGANIGWIHLGDGNLLVTDSMDRLDSEGDGIADAWKYRYFGTLGGASEGSDYNGDGYSDLQHYLAGTDPTGSVRPLEITHFNVVANMTGKGAENMAQFEFTSTPRRLYRIDSSSTLEAWTAAGDVFSPDPGDTTIRLLAPIPPDREFYRIRAIRPLDPAAAE